jgi:hypothetical protein
MSFANICWYVGKWSLVTLITFGASALGVFGWAGEWYWLVAIAVCFAGVIGSEIVSFIFKHKSISSQYGEFIKRDPVKAYAGLGFFSLAMISLVLHLIAYGFKEKPIKDEIPKT